MRIRSMSIFHAIIVTIALLCVGCEREPAAEVVAVNSLPHLNDELLIEAEQFEDWGGWVNDTQFMDQMGSPYLLAHGLGKKVANAKTSFVVDKPGRYCIFARTRNWTREWNSERTPGAGLFSIVVDGKKLDYVFGNGSKEWGLEGGVEVELLSGEHTLELEDMTGFDGRCDCVVITRVGKKPSLLRANSPLVDKGKFDIVVVGGGIAGISAAVSSARLGLKTALIQDRPVLGGNNSSEIRVHLGARINIAPYPKLGDTVAEMGPATGGNAREASVYEDQRKLDYVAKEKNLSLFLNEHVNSVEVEKGIVKAVISQNTRSGVRSRFEGALFADCTGDGTVGYLAGAEYRMGRESRLVTKEPSAPKEADSMTMGASVQWNAGVAANGKVDFPLQPWMITFNKYNGKCMLLGDWDWETGMGRDQIAEAEHIRDYGMLVVYSNWAYAKNNSEKTAEFADKELKWVAYNAGRRESRRLIGDVILDENMILERKELEDATCASTWTIDLHFPRKKSDTNYDGEPFRSATVHKKIWPYAVPYRCYYSKNINNLFMAGRNISVTHAALGSTRLMRTHGMMGEVVGMAASICKENGCLPRDVYKTHLGKLKALMERGVGDGSKNPPQKYNEGGSLAD